VAVLLANHELFEVQRNFSIATAASKQMSFSWATKKFGRRRYEFRNQRLRCPETDVSGRTHLARIEKAAHLSRTRNKLFTASDKAHY
jgi:hypothetical protein